MAEFKDASQGRRGSKQSDIPVTIKSWLSCGCSELRRLPLPPPLLLYRFAAQAWTLCHPADPNGTMGGTVISSYLSSRRRVFCVLATCFCFQTTYVSVGVGDEFNVHHLCFLCLHVNKPKMSAHADCTLHWLFWSREFWSMYMGLIFKTFRDKILWPPDIILNLWF